MNIRIELKSLGEISGAGPYTVKGIGTVHVVERDIVAINQFDDDAQIELIDCTAAADITRNYRIGTFIP